MCQIFFPALPPFFLKLSSKCFSIHVMLLLYTLSHYLRWFFMKILKCFKFFRLCSCFLLRWIQFKIWASSYPFNSLNAFHVGNSYLSLSCLFIPLYSISSAEDISEDIHFHSYPLKLFWGSHLIKFLIFLVQYLFLSNCLNIVLFEWAHNPHVFPRILPGSSNLSEDILKFFSIWRRNDFHHSYSFSEIASNNFSLLAQPCLFICPEVSQ